ncbi:interferon-induced protein 44-like isoform X2 [Siniperca chuatsi]|uniref:interferon-induced protein 44-like isoform X2 n=1 Tax=Siniperca chuatsi TaxID=119488 RepID=UPI001CE09DA7|nr:interferon-induced protein 44-like isoform X2 [Siniperca chuatsi]
MPCHAVQSHISKAMGGATFSKPWRTMPQNKKENLDFVTSYQPRNTDVKHLRILLHGPIGAGKSSFVNSVESVLRGRIVGRAPADAISGTSYTKKI